MIFLVVMTAGVYFAWTGLRREKAIRRQVAQETGIVSRPDLAGQAELEIWRAYRRQVVGELFLIVMLLVESSSFNYFLAGTFVVAAFKDSLDGYCSYKVWKEIYK